MTTLKQCAEKLLRGFPPSYRDMAIKAVENGKAFCPSCVSAGHMNCGYFDECQAFIEPNGCRAR